VVSPEQVIYLITLFSSLGRSGEAIKGCGRAPQECGNLKIPREEMGQAQGQKKPTRAKKSAKDGEPGETAWSGGEFFDPNASLSVPREIAKRQFLLAASELYSVTADLRDNVFPHFPALGASLEQEPLKSELKKWIDRYRLGQPWVLRQVTDTLNIWKLDPRVARLDEEKPPWHPLFHFVIRRPRPASTEPFVFSYLAPNFEITPDGVKDWQETAGWNLELERREKFVAEARRQFERALMEYLTDQEAKAAKRGLIRTKRSRAPKITIESKVQWVVRRYCGAMEFEQIASAHLQSTGQNIDISTIIKATKEISLLIDLDY
jgi:hypothetical protein